MKQIKNIALGVLAAVFVVAAAPVAPAHAACYYNGYMYPDSVCDSTGQYLNPNTYNYNYNYNNQSDTTYRNQLMTQIAQLNALLNRLRTLQNANVYTGGYYPPYQQQYYYGSVSAETRGSQDIGSTQATLLGAVNFTYRGQATVYFQYGPNSNDLRYATTHVVQDGNNSRTTFQATVINLTPGQTYYYRAVAIDHNGNVKYASLYHFTTNYYNYNYNYNYNYGSNYCSYPYNNSSCWNYNYNNNYSYNTPQVTTDGVYNVTNSAAEIRGSVDMRGISGGNAFFVYGLDRNAVVNVPNNYNTYWNINTTADYSLRKATVGSVQGMQGNYHYNFYNLSNNTTYYYAMCVEYSQNNTDHLQCGSVNSFRTY